jgi:hypothetical protein
VQKKATPFTKNKIYVKLKGGDNGDNEWRSEFDNEQY